MESFLAGRDLGSLLTSVGATVKNDDHEWAQTVSDEEIAKDKLLMHKNRMGAGHVLGSINVDSDKDKAAFGLVATLHNAVDGFPGGHFKNEWIAWTEWFVEIERDDVYLLTMELYSMEMASEEHPSIFLMKMKKRIILEKKEYVIDDTAFVKDALSKLPGGESKGPGVYDAVNLMAKKELGKAVVAYDLKQLTKDLKKMYRECVKEDEC